MKRFTGAMMQAGLDPALKLNGIEMINALAKRYEDDLDLALAAAELGIDKADFKQASGDVDPKFRSLVRRLSQSSIPRDQFELAFRELAPSLTDLKVVLIANARPPQPLAKPIRNDDLALTSDADNYRIGDSPVFTVVSARDCFLSLADVDEKGGGTVLLPNAFQQDNHIKAGVPIQFPGPNAPFKFRMKDPGTETIVAVCSTQANGGDRIQHDFQRNSFTSVADYNAVLGRAIAIDPVAQQSAATPGAGAAAGNRPSFRAAIRVGVR
jgi:hypothetical protein